MSLEEIINFVPGELVVKSRGSYKGKIGIVLSVITNPAGNTLVTVLSEGKVSKWYAQYVELI